MLIERRKKLTSNVALMSVGLDTYWKQFDGLLDEMKRKAAILKERLTANCVNVTDVGMVDNALAAADALPKILAADPDVLFVDMVTYATSSTFGMIVRAVKCPVVLIALQPLRQMDYAHGTTFMQLCNDDICSVPEFTGVAIRMGRPVADVIIGMLDNDPVADEQLAKWCRISHAIHDLRHARLGQMGHVLEAMLDMQTDPTAVTAAFGAHVVQCEADEIVRIFENVREDEPDVAAMSRRILSVFETPNPVSDPLTTKLTDEDLVTAARDAVALERFIAQKNLDGFAYYYEGTEETLTRKVVTNFIVGNSLLTSAGFPMCGEFDIKTCIAMLIMDRLEIGGSFAEFHPMDFADDSILLGHDGPHHLNITGRQPVIRSLRKYHGKPGKGASVEFSIKTGPITLMSCSVNAQGKFKFVIAEGESVAGDIPPTGNTNTHAKFPQGMRQFMHDWCMAGPTHHFALGIGHHADELRKIGEAFGVETIVVR